MKTISDKAIELYPLRNIGGAAEFQQAAFKKGVEFAQRWIPVEEELPTEDGKYLVKGKYGIFINHYNGFHECWDDEDGDDYSSDLIGGNVTHWRTIELK